MSDPARIVGGHAIPPEVEAEIAAQPHPLLFVTISGAHLYGFPSPDSDWDLRGVHLLPLRDVVGLAPRRETIEHSPKTPGVELDLVTHDAAKFFRMLLQRNGYVLEQLTSPLVLRTSPGHEELLAIAKGCVTSRHAHHYLGFAATQRKLVVKERRVKALLYLYRVLLTGLHLLRTGVVEANLETLLGLVAPEGASEIAALIQMKRGGTEKGALPDADVAHHEARTARLERQLEEAREGSPLPEAPGPETRQALDDLLVRLRLGRP